MKKPNPTTFPHDAELTAVTRRLQRETVRRKAAEAELKESHLHYGQLLAQSCLMQKQLRHLSHQILLAQEEERKHISRELHDEISQILTGINVRLATLKLQTTTNTANLKKKIVNTQRLVEKSVEAVHRFARELRPPMLDDLGLIPALLAFMKEFGKRTGLRIRFTSVPADKLESLDSFTRTAFYRVAQEALTNAVKHGHATLAKVAIQLRPNILDLEISNNGTSFDVARTLNERRRNGLGLVGMRERMEIVGGTFAITSVPDNSTTVRVQVPFHNGNPAATGHGLGESAVGE